MMKSTTPSYSQLGVFLLINIILLLSVSPVVNGVREKIDVPAEIDKMAQKFESFEKPSPEMINTMMEEIRSSCKTNRTIDEPTLRNISSCVDGLFNETALVTEFKDSIPKGDMDNVFRNICLKWPSVESCLKPGFDIIEECWGNGSLVNKGVESMVKFFCGKDNDGAHIALFFAEGGLSCLDSHGEEVKTCVNELNTGENQEDLCSTANQIHECLNPLKNCKDPHSTPHNLVTSMVREVGRVMGCPPIDNLTSVSPPPQLMLTSVPYLLFFSLTAVIFRR